MCCEMIKCRCRAPECFQAGSGSVGAPGECTVLCGEDKEIERCRAPECSEPEVAGLGHLDWAASTSYEKKHRNCSMFQEFVRMLPSESFSL